MLSSVHLVFKNGSLYKRKRWFIHDCSFNSSVLHNSFFPLWNNFKLKLTSFSCPMYHNLKRTKWPALSCFLQNFYLFQPGVPSALFFHTWSDENLYYFSVPDQMRVYINFSNLIKWEFILFFHVEWYECSIYFSIYDYIRVYNTFSYLVIWESTLFFHIWSYKSI